MRQGAGNSEGPPGGVTGSERTVLPVTERSEKPPEVIAVKPPGSAGFKASGRRGVKGAGDRLPRRTVRVSTEIGGNKGPKSEAVSRSTTGGVAWPERLRAHRQRQASVASILDSSLGRFGETAPDLWDRRAYLMLVGLVYERLAADEMELTTDELIGLAKVLAESRKVELRAGLGGSEESGGRNGLIEAGPSGLPSAFGEVLRQVYGTGFSGDRGERSEESGTLEESGGAGG